MKLYLSILLVSAAVVFTGCATTDEDPLREAYLSGELSEEEYRARCVERDEALARVMSAHSETLYIQRSNRSKLER